MNVRMWQHEATQRNVAQLRADGVTVLEPDEGEMACGEYGPGRLPEPEAILAAIGAKLGPAGELSGKHVLVTAGPTHEPIDPVRVIANRSSGKQGFAIAAGAGGGGRPGDPGRRPGRASRPPRSHPDRRRDRRADGLRGRGGACPPTPRSWSPRSPTGGSARRIEAQESRRPAAARLGPQPRHPRRPRHEPSAAAAADRLRRRDRGRRRQRRAKRERKGADWIVANDVSGDVMGGAQPRPPDHRRRRRGPGRKRPRRSRPPSRRKDRRALA
jgi:phosphopantothenoylcysteine decarboxylase/phosphopantothenate--cysteine ligase